MRTIQNLAKALIKFQSEMPKIDKTSKTTVKTKGGGEYSFLYADLFEVMNKILPVLTKNGLGVAQVYENDEKGEYIVTILVHDSGETIESRKFVPKLVSYTDDKGILKQEDAFNGPQEEGSYLSYLRRYCVCAMLGIVSQEDDDGNIASKKSKSFTAGPRDGGNVAGNGHGQGTTTGTQKMASQAQLNALKKKFPMSDEEIRKIFPKWEGWDKLTMEGTKPLFEYQMQK